MPNDPLVIVVRARDAGHAAHLYRIGASDAVPETIEASLQLSEAVLVDVGVPIGPVIQAPRLTKMRGAAGGNQSDGAKGTNPGAGTQAIARSIVTAFLSGLWRFWGGQAA